MNYNHIKLLGVVIVSALIFNGCIEHRSDEVKSKKIEVKNNEEEKFLQDKDYKQFHIYEGEVPCEDCDVIEQRLVVKGDTAGIFRLTETYKNATEDGDATIVCSGQWKKIISKSKTIFVLSQGSLSDSVRRMEYEYHPMEMIQLSLDDNRFKNASSYRLKLVRKSK
jgi:copper homeostasis protein (lipoprotein)